MKLNSGDVVPFLVAGTNRFAFALYVGRMVPDGPDHAVIHSYSTPDVAEFSEKAYFSSQTIYPWPVSTYLFEELREDGALRVIGNVDITKSPAYQVKFYSRSPERGLDAMQRYYAFSDWEELLRQDSERGHTITIEGWRIDAFEDKKGIVEHIESRYTQFLTEAERTFQYELRPEGSKDIAYHFTGIGSDAPFHAGQIFR